MKITKQRLKEIIREELNETGTGLGDIQTAPKFTGGTPEERMLTLIKAGEVLAGLGDEEMAQLRAGLDEETLEALGKLLGNPMYAPNPFDFRGMQEEGASTAAERDKKRDAAARKQREEREKDPTYSKVKAATEKHLEKEKRKREERGIKNETHQRFNK